MTKVVDLDAKRPLKRWWQGMVWRWKDRPKFVPGDLKLLLLGIILILASGVGEHPAMGLLGTAEHTVEPEGSVSERAELALRDWHTWLAFTRELGFALIIAWGVSSFIDARVRAREKRESDRVRDQLNAAVVHGVFKLLHDENYVECVVEKTLLARIIRRKLVIDYWIDALTEEEEKKFSITSGRLVKFTQRLSCSFENVSQDLLQHTIKAGLAVRSGKLAEGCFLEEVSIDGVLNRDEIDKACTSEDGYKTYRWLRTIEPGKPIEVVIKAVSLKELSDTEVWGNYHPVYDGVDLNVRNSVPEIINFGIRNLTATHVVKELEDGVRAARWSFRGPILPNDSVVFWWRNREDDGSLGNLPVAVPSAEPAAEEPPNDSLTEVVVAGSDDGVP
ncbi:MAG TPA: hypothetical protein PLE81_09385 [Brevundimonas sp.]|jgi:hypothetical protein|uniref:hypothetical protein n=1 Tax=Brevundimonas sp. TaxID=1871086 RepID=UPI002BE20BD8|nr:hypothetical protein [Brevundimonas sp.]HRH20833.1 hypothetical protein [Brevundimonas sp.]